MEGPFQYCKVETGRNFVGRKKELGILSNLLAADENVCLYDGPKTGKTSLLHQCFVSMRLSGRDFQAAVSDGHGQRVDVAAVILLMDLDSNRDHLISPPSGRI